VLGKVWACVAAVICGVLIVEKAGGPLPIASKLALASVLTGLTLTLIVLLRARSARRTLGSPERPKDSVRSHGDSPQPTIELLSEAEIGWLRSQTFTDPWRDDHLAPLRKLARSNALPSEAASWNPRLYGDLTEATRAFLAAYEQNTLPDPVIAGSTWRTIGLAGSFQDLIEVDDAHREAIGERLARASARVGGCYDDVKAAGGSSEQTASDQPYPARPSSTQPLWPPRPIAFESATSRSTLRAWFGT
jgi:hypothetical protein